MWDILKVTYEGTTEVKRVRLDTLNNEHELFKKKPEENISQIQTRFTHITNHVRTMGLFFQMSNWL